MDSEGDWIELRNDADLAHAIEISPNGLLKITIHTKEGSTGGNAEKTVKELLAKLDQLKSELEAISKKIPSIGGSFN